MSNWISVEERLPEKRPTKALCFSDKKEIMVGTFSDLGWMFPCYFGKVAYWMPLPEPPKEGDAE